MSGQYSLFPKVFVKHLGTRIEGRKLHSSWWKTQIQKHTIKAGCGQLPARSERWRPVWVSKTTSSSKASPPQAFRDTWKSLEIPLGSFIHWPASLPHWFQLLLRDFSFISSSSPWPGACAAWCSWRAREHPFEPDRPNPRRVVVEACIRAVRLGRLTRDWTVIEWSIRTADSKGSHEREMGPRTSKGGPLELPSREGLPHLRHLSGTWEGCPGWRACRWGWTELGVIKWQNGGRCAWS